MDRVERDQTYRFLSAILRASDLTLRWEPMEDSYHESDVI